MFWQRLGLVAGDQCEGVGTVAHRLRLMIEALGEWCCYRSESYIRSSRMTFLYSSLLGGSGESPSHTINKIASVGRALLQPISSYHPKDSYRIYAITGIFKKFHKCKIARARLHSPSLHCP